MDRIWGKSGVGEFLRGARSSEAERDAPGTACGETPQPLCGKVRRFGVLGRWRKAKLLSGCALTGDGNNGSGRVGGETSRFQFLWAELRHLEVDGEEAFVRADEVVGFCIDDDDSVFGAIPAEIG